MSFLFTLSLWVLKGMVGIGMKDSKQQLFNVSTLAQSLHDRLHDDDELPEWVQSSLAVIEAKLMEVAGHLEYKIHRKED